MGEHPTIVETTYNLQQFVVWGRASVKPSSSGWFLVVTHKDLGLVVHAAYWDLPTKEWRIAPPWFPQMYQSRYPFPERVVWWSNMPLPPTIEQSYETSYEEIQKQRKQDDIRTIRTVFGGPGE